MSNDIIKHDAGVLTTPQQQPVEQDFGMLDAYAGGIVHDAAHIDALATISAGYRDDKGMPQRSRDGTIHVHDPEGRAPGLTRILEENGGKQLTVAFAFNSIQDFVQQRYSAYSRSALLAYGDENGITEIVKKGSGAEHVHHAPGTPGFERMLTICKVSVSVYFSLVQWENDVPVMIWPDGFGQYRLRFTSRNSLRNIMGQLQRLAQFTSGRFAGIPFDLRIVNREVADPTGMKRTIPAWTITMNSPAGLSMSSSTFRQLASAGVEQARQLQLDPPEVETIDMALLDMPDVDLDTTPERAEQPLSRPDRIARDGRIINNPEVIDIEMQEPTPRDIALMQANFDYEAELNRFFAAVKNTPLDDDTARAEALAREFDGISSLRDVLTSGITAEQWDEFLGDLHFTAAEQKRREHDNDFTTYKGAFEPEQVEWLQKQIERAVTAGLPYGERLAFLSWMVQRPLRKNTDITLDDLSVIKDGFYELNPETDRYRMLPDAAIERLITGYNAASTTDTAFDDLLDGGTKVPAREARNVGGVLIKPINENEAPANFEEERNS